MTAGGTLAQRQGLLARSPNPFFSHPSLMSPEGHPPWKMTALMFSPAVGALCICFLRDYIADTCLQGSFTWKAKEGWGLAWTHPEPLGFIVFRSLCFWPTGLIFPTSGIWVSCKAASWLVPSFTLWFVFIDFVLCNAVWPFFINALLGCLRAVGCML